MASPFSSLRTECPKCGGDGFAALHGNLSEGFCHSGCGMIWEKSEGGTGGNSAQKTYFDKAKKDPRLYSATDAEIESYIRTHPFVARSPRYLTNAEVAAYCELSKNGNNFVRFLAGLIGRAETVALIQKWNIGTAEDGRTLFFYRDSAGAWVNAKKILYGLNGNRSKDKADYPYFFRKEADGFGQCLYGEWQLPQFPNAGVCLLEAEKSAVLADYSFGNENLIFLASGGKGSITHEKAKALNGRRVVLFLDADVEATTLEKSKATLERAGAWVVIKEPSTVFKYDALPKGYDLADYVVELLAKENEPNASPVRRDNPPNGTNTLPSAKQAREREPEQPKLNLSELFKDADKVARLEMLISAFDCVIEPPYPKPSEPAPAIAPILAPYVPKRDAGEPLPAEQVAQAREAKDLFEHDSQFWVNCEGDLMQAWANLSPSARVEAYHAVRSGNL